MCPALLSSVLWGQEPTALPILLPCLSPDPQLSCPCCAQMQEERVSLEQVQGDERSTRETDRAALVSLAIAQLSCSTTASLNISKVSRRKKEQAKKAGSVSMKTNVFWKLDTDFLDQSSLLMKGLLISAEGAGMTAFRWSLSSSQKR